MIAELVREAALEGVRDELPHSLAVVVEEMVPREGRPDDEPLLDVRVEPVRGARQPEGDRHRQGRRPAARRRHPGPRARSRRCSGRGCYLDLRVKVAKDWQRDPKQLGRLGF